VGDRHPQVVARQGAIEVDRCREALDRGVCGLLEAAAPELSTILIHGRKSRKEKGFSQGRD
jgi:hypothetical protein